MPKPPVRENQAIWSGRYGRIELRTSSSHEEGANGSGASPPQRLEGTGGMVDQALHGIAVDAKFKPVPGSEFTLPADLVLLAMGFVHPGA